MSTSKPSQPPSSSILQNDAARSQAQLIRFVAISCVVLCPLILALPPRKLDAYSVLLVSGTCLGGNQVAYEYTGRSILTRIQDIASRSMTVEENGLRTMEKKERGVLGQLAFEKLDGDRSSLVRKININSPMEEQIDSGVLAELRRKLETNTKDQDVPPGEKSAWKKERDRREKEALEEGKGYGDMISEQIWEVWNWGKEKTENAENKVEKTLEESKEQKNKDRK